MGPLSHRQWAGVLALAVILGCTASKVASQATQASLNELAPEADPGAKAVLNYNGQTVDVDVVHTLTNGTELINLNRDGETLEHETYVRTPKAFLLKEADGEQFDPPLPLINTETASPWSGELVSGGINHAATATVTVGSDVVKTKREDFPATRVIVSLQLDSGGSKKAERTLKFWMVKGHGVLAREFGMGVKRQPDN